MLDLHHQNQPQRDMLYYHAGRICTYGVLGVLATLLSHLVFSSSFSTFSRLLLLVAGLSFIVSALFPRKTHHCCHTKSWKFQHLIEKRLPPTIALYLRGSIMGFVPCGLTLSALLMVATLSSPIHAFTAMLLFGISTIPVLQIMGYGALTIHRNTHHTTTTRTSRGLLACNGLWLCLIGLNSFA